MRRLKWLLGGLLALISLWTVFFLEVEALSLLLVTSSVIVAALIWPQLPAHVPALLWRLSVPAIVCAVVADFYFNANTLPALIRLAILLVLYRAASYRRKREDLQLIVLGLFLIVVAGVLTVSLGFAFLLLLFTACALGFLFCVTLIDMTDTGPKVMRPEEMSEVPAWAKLSWGRFFARLRQVIEWRLICFATGLFALVVVSSAVLFLVIPRFEMGNSFFLDKYITRKSHTGFSETVKFGEVGELVRDDSVAMRVDLTDASSLHESPYWRLIVLDEYTPQGFRLSDGLKLKLYGSQQTQQYLRGRRISRPLTAPVGGVWTFYVEPEVSRFLPLPGRFSTLRLSSQLPIQTSEEQQLIALRNESMSMVAFQMEGVTLDSRIADPAFVLQRQGRWIRESAKAYDETITLRGPKGPDNEAVLNRVVREIAGGAELDTATFVRKATDWLRVKHSYALSSRIPPGPADDIVKWLDSNEPGFCEYYAASLTVLCRAAGHPARVIAGFHGGTLNAFENYFMVKNSDAHAWTEVFDDRGEWFRVDATPGAIASGSNVASPTVRHASDRSWTARFDSLRLIWYRHVVNFDAQQQVKMIENVKAFTSDTGRAWRNQLESLTQRFKTWLAGPWNFTRAGTVLQLLVALGMLGWSLTRAWHWSRLAWRMWRSPGSYDPVRGEAGHWLGKLAQCREASTEPNKTVENVHQDLLRLRYGRKETWPEPREVFRQARRARRLVKIQRIR